MDNKFSIIPYEEKYKPQVLELFQLAFDMELKESFYTWRFLNHPSGKVFVELCVDQNHKLLSHLGGCAASSFYKGENFLSAHTMFGMTHPDYNGLGFFSTLCESLDKRMLANDGVKVDFGFPNENSHYSYIHKLNWNDVYLIPTLRRKVQPLKSAVSLPHEMEKFDKEKFNRLWKTVSSNSNYFFPNSRTAEFIEWRLINCPTKKYKLFTWTNSDGELDAYVAVKSYENNGSRELDVVDILATQNVNQIDLLRSIMQYAFENKYTYLNTWATMQSDLYGAAEKCGFYPSGPGTYLVFSILNNQQNLPDLQKAVSWHVSMADSDVY